jgi:arylsulfatase A-like enzyme
MNVGRLLQTLGELGLDDNTIVVFTSDNGGLCTLSGKRPGPTCNLPWRAGKGWLYEGGIRVTCLVRWPRGLQPTTVAVPAYTADLYPTLLELCELPAEPVQCRDGRSLARVLRGEPDPVLTERSLAWYYPHDHGSGHRAGAALRHGNWKLIRYFATDQTELYDLASDPGEQHEVSREHPEFVQSLVRELDMWIANTTEQQ